MPRLLLVDDAPEVGLLVERLGRRLGLEVARCTDVAAAWACLRQTRPDLVLLDLNLVGERGEALCRRVRAAPETADLRIALFVHWDCAGDLVSGLEAGADYVVAKDLLRRPEAWQARVAEILAADDGLTAPVSLSYQRNSLLPPLQPQGVAALERALRHPLLRQLGLDVARLILRRAVRRAADLGAPNGGDAGRWLQPDGLTLDAVYLTTTVSSQAVAAFTGSVAEQLERLLGTAVSAPARQMLYAALSRPDPPDVGSP